MQQSRYDRLFNKFHQIDNRKAGARYEILAAMVLKSLHELDVVIHDIKLHGDDPEVKHQIDITIDRNGSPHRILIECKDYDISGDKVDLDIVRSFRSVIEDTRADEGWIITCNDFTIDARKYAKSKNIKLALLRTFIEKDMEGRIVKIILNIIAVIPTNPVANIYLDENQAKHFQSACNAAGIKNGIHLNDDAWFLLPDGTRRHFNDVLSEEMRRAIGWNQRGLARVAIKPEGRRLYIAGTEVPYQGFVINFTIDEEKLRREIVSNRTAELLLSGFGESDIIIFSDQIERRKIDPLTGEIL